MPRSRRSRWVSRSSRRRSAASPRSSATVKTAFSSLPGLPTILPAACSGSWMSPAFASASQPRRDASVEPLSVERVYGRLEAILVEVARAADGLPRVLFVGRGRYSLPLSDSQAKKWHAVEKVIDYRVLGGAEPGFGWQHRALPAQRAHPAGRRSTERSSRSRLPFRIARQIREFDPDAIVCADPFICAAALVGRRLARRSTPVIAEVHGDWRTFTRSYGSERTPGALPPRRRRRLRGAPPGRRNPGSLVVHLASDRGGTWRARHGVVPGVQRPLRVRRAPGRPLPERPDRALRRDAGGLQEHRRPRRGLAPRRGRICRTPGS